MHEQILITIMYDFFLYFNRIHIFRRADVTGCKWRWCCDNRPPVFPHIYRYNTMKEWILKLQCYPKYCIELLTNTCECLDVEEEARKLWAKVLWWCLPWSAMVFKCAVQSEWPWKDNCSHLTTWDLEPLIQIVLWKCW